ncbi:MAG: putative calcyclin-binding protein [Streblomastix strix]|uniref:Putative calcyclin-binding protein n=1 Tax=Streblomastix strix TaxID=222440 RepID=A0A5J4WP19_9EUKA|nr:MAG: putative calcyclin-binding protein [Streblomastix strix]
MEEKGNPIDLDIAELERLLAIAERAKVKQVIEQRIKELRAEKETHENEELIPIPEPVAQPITKSYIDIQDAAFAQEDDNILLYWELAGIGQVDREKIQATFEQTSVVCTIEGFNEKNYRFSIGPLYNKIRPKDAKYKVLKNQIKFILPKLVFPDHWPQLKKVVNRLAQKQEEDEEKKKKKGKDGKKDPQEEIMDLMRNLYQNGDPQMKQMIAKTWTETQDRKQGKLPPQDYSHMHDHDHDHHDHGHGHMHDDFDDDL